MSKIVRIPTNVVLVVCDSKKALVLTNVGAIAEPKLQIEESLERPRGDDNSSHGVNSGTRFDGGAAAASGGSRSAMEISDPEEKYAEGFAESIISALDKRHKRTRMRGLVLVAPPSFLGVLRQKMSEELKQVLQQEIAKELTEMPLPEIQKVLLRSL